MPKGYRKRQRLPGVLEEHDVQACPAEGGLPQRTIFWIESQPGKRYRIFVIDNHPEKRKRALRKEVLSEVEVNGDCIDTTSFVTHGPDVTFTQVMVDEFETEDEGSGNNVSHPLRFPSGPNDIGPIPTGGIGTITVKLTHGTQTYIDQPALAPPVRSKKPRGSVVEEQSSAAPAQPQLHDVYFETHGKEPHHEIMIKYCTRDILNKHLNPTGPQLYEAYNAAAPPSPRSLASSSTPAAITRQKRPRSPSVQLTDSTRDRPAKKFEAGQRRQLKDYAMEAIEEVQIAERSLREAERTLEEDELTVYENILKKKKDSARKAEAALRGAVKRHAQDGAISERDAEQFLQFLKPAEPIQGRKRVVDATRELDDIVVVEVPVKAEPGVRSAR